MKILLMLLISLILLFVGIKLYITWCLIYREKEEDFCDEVLFLVRRENIPIMEDVVALGVLRATHSVEWITEENWKVHSKICKKNRNYIWKSPEIYYNTFKKELCGNFSNNWEQALTEAKILRLENLNK